MATGVPRNFPHREGWGRIERKLLAIRDYYWLLQLLQLSVRMTLR